jgi:hypothetical protein
MPHLTFLQPLGLQFGVIYEVLTVAAIDVSRSRFRSYTPSAHALSVCSISHTKHMSLRLDMLVTIGLSHDIRAL